MRRFAFLPLLAACAVGPDYVAPEVALRDRYLEAPPGEAAPWQPPADPVLQSLLADAVAASYDLRIAAARVEEARALRRGARAERLPEVDVAGSAERRRDSENAPFPGGDDDYTQLRFGFESSWEIDLWGRVRRQVEAAEADLAATEELFHDARRVVLAEVASEYAALRGAERALDVARRNIETQRGSVELTQSLSEEGLGSHADVARALGRLRETEAAVPLIEAEIAAGAHRLAVLTGGDAAEIRARLSAASSLPETPALPSPGVPSELLRARPDIRAAERELAAATARIGVATADLYPRITLFGTFGAESAEIESLFDADSVSFGVGPSVRWPLLDFGRVRARIAAQGARERAALARYERTVARAVAEVETALASFRSRVVNRDRLAEALAHNRESLELVEVRFREGTTSFLEVLDAQRNVLAVEAALSDAQTALLLDHVALGRALGRIGSRTS